MIILLYSHWYLSDCVSFDGMLKWKIKTSSNGSTLSAHCLRETLVCTCTAKLSVTHTHTLLWLFNVNVRGHSLAWACKHTHIHTLEQPSTHTHSHTCFHVGSNFWCNFIFSWSSFLSEPHEVFSIYNLVPQPNIDFGIWLLSNFHKTSNYYLNNYFKDVTRPSRPPRSWNWLCKKIIAMKI